MTRILVLYHSRHGSTANLANLIARGVASEDGCEAMLRCVPLLDPSRELPADAPPTVDMNELQQCDGLIIGSPGHFGGMAAEMKAFWDGTTAAWFSGDLTGKPAAVFASTATQHGGQEVVLRAMMTPLLHHGLLICGLPYSIPQLSSTQTGGSPYGATHVAGSKADATLSDDEKLLAKALGKRVANIAKRLKASA